MGRQLLVLLLLILPFIPAAVAKDDGRYAQSPLKPWFDSLTNKKMQPCCSDADGRTLKDVDWEFNGHEYRVRIDGDWISVPDDAVIEKPNRAGVAMVWRTWVDGKNVIVCFIPGAFT